MASRGNAGLQQRVAALPECDLNLNWGRIFSSAPRAPIRAIAPIRAVPAGGGIIRVEGAGASAHAVRPVGSVHAAGAAAAGEVRDEFVIVAQGNIKLRVGIRMAGRSDGDVRELTVAEPGIFGEGDNALLVDGDHGCRHGKVAPHDLSFAYAFSLQDLAVWLGDRNHQRGLLSRADAGAFGLAGLDGRDWDFGKVDLHPELNLVAAHPLSASKEAAARQVSEILFVPWKRPILKGRKRVGELKWLMIVLLGFLTSLVCIL